MLDPDEIKKLLKEDEEIILGCINPEQFSSRSLANLKILRQDILTVKDIEPDGSIILGGTIGDGIINLILPSELKWFKIKEIVKVRREMIEEIRKEMRLKKKVFIECIDEEGFLNPTDCAGNKETNREILSQKQLKVSHTDINDTVYLSGELVGGSCNCINSNELKYFRIKINEPSFNDLIDVAVQALKDGILMELEIREDRFISGAIKEGLSPTHHFSTGSQSGGIAERIQFIKNLYAESFTIEVEDDIIRINEDAKTVMMNGHEFYGNKFEEFASSDIKTLFSLLKGSVVTQRRY